MKFNITKCKHLCITKKKNPHVANYSINGASILQTTCEKDLGVLVSNNLSWNSHIKKVARSSNKMLGLIYRTTQVWSPSGIGNIKELERVERRAKKYIRKSGEDYPERLSKLNLLPFCGV